MEIDEAFRIAGEYGPLQRRVCWSMAIPQMFVAWQIVLYAFVNAEPEFQCRTDTGKVYIDCQSADENQCHDFVFNTTNFTSIVSEWSLVCSNAYKADIVQSLFMAGVLIGNLVGAAIADHHGRRSVVTVNILGITLFSLLAASPVTAPTNVLYSVWRVFAGICVGGFGLVSYTLPAELVSGNERGFVNAISTVAFSLGVVSLSVLAFFIRDWRLLSLSTACPGLVGIYYFIILPESPRWLLSQGRVTEAEHQLSYIARVNSCQSLDNPIKLRQLACSSNSPSCGVSSRAGILDILRHESLRNRTVINVCVWFMTALVNFGLSLKAGDFGSNRYVSVAMVGIVELPADVVALYAMNRYGRRITSSCGLLLAGLFCFAIMPFPSPGYESAVLSLAMLGKLGIAISYCVRWTHAVEMYPTNIRNKALSICTISSRIGGIIFPFVLTLGRLYSGADFLIFGVAAFVAGLLGLKLPETLNRSLLKTAADDDDFEVVDILS